MLTGIKEFFSNHSKTLFVVLVLLLAFLIFNSISTQYHSREMKALRAQLKTKEKEFQEAVKEKVKFQDSSAYYESAAEKSGLEASIHKAKAEKERREKEAALAAMRNLPKEVIDSFFVKRYSKVPKSNVKLKIDRNVGNEIVVELVEKDHMEEELSSKLQENTALYAQVTSLESSLKFSKTALVQADSAITIRTQQLKTSKDLNDLLKKDLKTAKNKAFWNQFKGAGVGIAAGMIIGLLAK